MTDHGAFYAPHAKIYPRAVNGLYARLRIGSVLMLLGLYYGTPWLMLGERQAILFDLPARKFHLFGITLWPQDFFYLAGLLMIAALALFFFTTLAGRLWCGYACPQTVWTEAFLWMERAVEGDRMKRMKLDAQPMNAHKVAVKATKHVVWLTFAAWTGFTFVGYFTPIRELGHAVFSFSLGPWETFWVVFYGFATYGNAGFMREQVCIYMCPYARFQSAMFDKDTLIVSYDTTRGEPRGARGRRVDHLAKGLGECVDCSLCIQVCPMGIDIRGGLQYQCINCGSCVDVCNQVMDKMRYPRGLIRYTTDNALQGKATHLLRPRIVVYGVIILLLTAGLGYKFFMRTPLELDVIRDRRALYREVAGGLVENVYTLKILNMDRYEHTYRVSVSGLSGVEIDVPPGVVVASGEVRELPVRVRVRPEVLGRRSEEIILELTAVDEPDLTVREKARFLGPVR